MSELLSVLLGIENEFDVIDVARTGPARSHRHATIIFTFTDRVLYAIESYPAIPTVDGNWEVPYGFDDGGSLTLGTRQQVDITQIVVGAGGGGGMTSTSDAVAAAKGCPRNRSSDQQASDEAHDLLVKGGAVCEKASGSTSSGG